MKSWVQFNPKYEKFVIYGQVIHNMKPKQSSGGAGLTFKSSINAICQWWLLSVGLSAFIYILYVLIQRILEIMFKPKVEDTYYPTFDDVVSGLKGKVHFSLMFLAIFLGQIESFYE